MKRLVFLALGMLGAIRIAAADGEAGAIYGTVYRYVPGAKTPAIFPGITVLLFDASTRLPQKTYAAKSITDQNGRYSFYAVNPGPYKVFFYLTYNDPYRQSTKYSYGTRVTVGRAQLYQVKPIVLDARPSPSPFP